MAKKKSKPKKKSRSVSKTKPAVKPTENKMSAPKGNKYWELRGKSGRDTVYDAQTIWEKACEYFEWCQNNPWIKTDFIRGGDYAGDLVEIPVPRPFTLSGFCSFANFAQNTFDNYCKPDANDQDLLRICKHIREIIHTQKFEGAAVGVFNANIIARDLGLADKKEVEKKTTRINFKDAE